MRNMEKIHFSGVWPPYCISGINPRIRYGGFLENAIKKGEL